MFLCLTEILIILICVLVHFCSSCSMHVDADIYTFVLGKNLLNNKCNFICSFVKLTIVKLEFMKFYTNNNLFIDF